MEELANLLQTSSLDSRSQEVLPYTFIDSLNEIQLSLEKIKASSVIAIDCEGDNLSRAGALTLLQIRTETKDNFIFDVQILAKELMNLLKPILESTSILKLGYDFRNDYDALKHQFQIDTKHLLDLQLVTFWYREDLDIVTSLSQWFFENSNAVKYYWKKLYLPPLKKTDFLVTTNWKHRPLLEKELQYAANDLVLIFECYEKFISKLENESVKQKFLRASDKYINMFSNLMQRSFNKFEQNYIMPIHVFISYGYTIQCTLCKTMVSNEVCKKNPPFKCYRCLLQMKIAQRERNIAQSNYENDMYSGYDSSDSF